MKHFGKNKVSNKKIGSAPGTLFYVGRTTSADTIISMIDYNEDTIISKASIKIEECKLCHLSTTKTWINVDGVHNVDVINQIGKISEVHPLILEDIVNTDQRPKMADFQNRLSRINVGGVF